MKVDESISSYTTYDFEDSFESSIDHVKDHLDQGRYEEGTSLLLELILSGKITKEYVESNDQFEDFLGKLFNHARPHLDRLIEPLKDIGVDISLSEHQLEMKLELGERGWTTNYDELSYEEGLGVIQSLPKFSPSDHGVIVDEIVGHFLDLAKLHPEHAEEALLLAEERLKELPHPVTVHWAAFNILEAYRDLGNELAVQRVSQLIYKNVESFENPLEKQYIIREIKERMQ